MNKQKLIILGFSLILIAMISGTSAYFVATGRSHNIITTSGVAIEFIENTNRTGVDGRPVPFSDIDDARPGETYSSLPQIKNIDNSEIWARIKVLKIAQKNIINISLTNSEMITDYDFTHWLDGNDGYFYYYRTLKKNETTEPLFSQLKLAEDLNDTIGGSSYQLKLQAQAVQAINNGEHVLEAEGWPEE